MGGPVGADGGAGVAATIGDDCCETADMDTAESTCNELLLYGCFFIEFEWFNPGCISFSNASWLWFKWSRFSPFLYALVLANRLPITRTFSLLFGLGNFGFIGALVPFFCYFYLKKILIYWKKRYF